MMDIIQGIVSIEGSGHLSIFIFKDVAALQKLEQKLPAAQAKMSRFTASPKNRDLFKIETQKFRGCPYCGVEPSPGKL